MHKIHRHQHGGKGGAWYVTAKLYEVSYEIYERLKKPDDNDKADLLFYKELIMPAEDDLVASLSNKCADYPHKDDPLYVLGCTNNQSTFSASTTTVRYAVRVFYSWEENIEKLEKDSFKNKMGQGAHARGYYIKHVLESADEIYGTVMDLLTKKLYEEGKGTGYIEGNEEETNGGGSSGGTNLNVSDTGKDWWTAARDFFKYAKQSGNDLPASDLMNELTDMIFDVGNMIFIVVTSILGVRYIFAAAEGKAHVKDSLITLVVAALFFYGWQAIDTMLDIGNLFMADSYETVAQKLYNTILFIVNLAAVVGVIWIGVKYMLSSAEGKADIKTNWVPVILGLVMVYATIKFLSTIITTILG